MRQFISLMLLAVATAPVLAGPDTSGFVPEPESMALLGIGALALFVARQVKK